MLIPPLRTPMHGTPGALARLHVPDRVAHEHRPLRRNAGLAERDLHQVRRWLTLVNVAGRRRILDSVLHIQDRTEHGELLRAGGAGQHHPQT